jgi:hypothetical protein
MLTLWVCGSIVVARAHPSGNLVGGALGVDDGFELGLALGDELGVDDGFVLGATLGEDDGSDEEAALGDEIGALVGVPLTSSVSSIMRLCGVPCSRIHT